MGSDLKAWVSDKLSKQASSPSDFVSKLVDTGLSSTSQTQAFAQEIFAKVPRKASGLSLYQKQEHESAMLVRKQKTYTLLEDDEGEDAGNSSITPAASHSVKADTRKKRFRKKAENAEDEDDEA